MFSFSPLFDACSFCAVFVVVVVCGGVGGGGGGEVIYTHRSSSTSIFKRRQSCVVDKLSSADNEFTSVVLKQISSAQNRVTAESDSDLAIAKTEKNLGLCRDLPG